MFTLVLICGLMPTLAILIVHFAWKARWKRSQEQQSVNKDLLQQTNLHRQEIQTLLKTFEKEQIELRQRFDQHQINSLITIQDSLHKITKEVDNRLTLGFEKTTATFADVMKRLTIIDEAQKKITELSSDVVNLREILVDKRSRGAFGEVQLVTLIRNVMPEAHFSLQHTLSNGKRVDCLLLLPAPSGNIGIDSKFPFESYQTLIKPNLSEIEKHQVEQRFRTDLRKHIEDIAAKYILPPETAEGAMMFIPAEAIFAEIHAHFPDIVELAQREKVWMVSPTTMLAVLTTARAVLKDADTRKQVHVIQEHLGLLSKDFTRFAERMDNLARHIDQAHKDVNEVHSSSKKITSRFEKIEKVDLKEIPSIL